MNVNIRSHGSKYAKLLRSHRIVWERATYTSFLPESSRVSNDLRDALVEEGRALCVHRKGGQGEKKS